MSENEYSTHVVFTLNGENAFGDRQFTAEELGRYFVKAAAEAELLKTKLNKLEESIRKKDDALKFYADSNNYTEHSSEIPTGTGESPKWQYWRPVFNDRGKRAREVLNDK